MADAPVSQIKERPQLLVYRYASRASGPQSDGKETHLFHRCRQRHAPAASHHHQQQCMQATALAGLALLMGEGTAAVAVVAMWR